MYSLFLRSQERETLNRLAGRSGATAVGAAQNTCSFDSRMLTDRSEDAKGETTRESQD